MVMISLSASPACGPRFLAGWASWFSSRACPCGLKAWQKSSNWQKPSTSRSNIDTSPPLMVPTQEEECRGDKGLASPQTRNSGYDILFRWFVGLSIEAPVWDVRVFTKNRDRLLEGDIAHGFLRAILADPQVTRLLSNEH